MKNNVTHYWDLSNPKQCRNFLKEVRIGKEGAKITYLQQADGTEVSLDDASDDQILDVANQIAEAMNSK